MVLLGVCVLLGSRPHLGLLEGVLSMLVCLQGLPLPVVSCRPLMVAVVCLLLLYTGATIGGRQLSGSWSSCCPAGLWMCDGSWLPVVKSGNFCSGLASMFCAGLIFFSWLSSYLLFLRMWLDPVLSCHLWGLLAFALKLLVIRLGRPSWLC
ncbi:hypothetical protein Nepgr_007831 [Nepenthes gracilis]|uniref:Uncharacterized protein n=1 Tax=Nepenthes gracilis TaxID=150966 RepID=A0AAD3S8J3_NEPGR|nr:hypothetical protein Nepgr_007831 [Nepenthes gracilis]